MTTTLERDTADRDRQMAEGSVFTQEDMELKGERKEPKVTFVFDASCGIEPEEMERLSELSHGRIYPKTLPLQLYSMEERWIETDKGNHILVDEPVMLNPRTELFLADLNNGHYKPGRVMSEAGSSLTYFSFFEEMADAKVGKVVYIGSDSVLASGIYRAIESALKGVRRTKEFDFDYFDTKCISGGYALVAYLLSTYYGDTPFDYVKSIAARISQLFTVRDFQFVNKSVKLSNWRLFMPFLKYPWFELDCVGNILLDMHMTQLTKKVRNYYESSVKNILVRKLIQDELRREQIYKSYVFDPIPYVWADYYLSSRFAMSDSNDEEAVVIVYGSDSEQMRASTLASILMEAGVSIASIQFMKLSPAIAVHVGPTAFGLFFVSPLLR